MTAQKHQIYRGKGAERIRTAECDLSGFLYFIQAADGGPIKIGWAKDPKKRLSILQVAHHEELVLLAAVRSKAWKERDLHERFSEHRIRGEWFDETPELLWLISCCPQQKEYVL